MLTWSAIILGWLVCGILFGSLVGLFGFVGWLLLRKVKI